MRRNASVNRWQYDPFDCVNIESHTIYIWQIGCNACVCVLSKANIRFGGASRARRVARLHVCALAARCSVLAGAELFGASRSLPLCDPKGRRNNITRTHIGTLCMLRAGRLWRDLSRVGRREEPARQWDRMRQRTSMPRQHAINI